jgi:CRP/FNR family transcriptional regulator, cyclic AMP receptor protein
MSKDHPLHASLKAIPLFHDFTDSEIEEFLDLTDPTAFRAGDIIVRQNEPGNCMYYVAEGRCRVFVRSNEQIVELAELGPGEIFGELALFDHQPRSADVRAITDCVLMKVNEGVLRALAGVFPNAAFKFLLGTVREISERLRKANARYVDTILSIAP